MEEKNIKNFDRKIEHMMNEYSVSPPFGMWNRISAELDAVAPVAQVAPARPFMPRGVVAGFVSGALLVGTVITGWLYYNGSQKQDEKLAVNTPVRTENVVPMEETISKQPVQNPEEKPILLAITTSKKAETVLEDKQKQWQPEAGLENKKSDNLNTEVAAPNKPIANNGAKAEEPYYFPPVDINEPETTSTEVDRAVFHVDKKAEKVQDEENDKQTKVSSGSNQRVKFKKPRRPKFSYGRLNRLK